MCAGCGMWASSRVGFDNVLRVLLIFEAGDGKCDGIVILAPEL